MTPRLTVAIASHERPLRLRWLLNALEDQTLPRTQFEVVVCFDDAGEQTARLLAEHPLGVRAIRLAAGTGTPARQRNAAWRAGGAPAVLFTDDDCRPPADWLARAAAAAARHPDAVVQGTVRPDPDELMLLMRTPHARSLRVDPPTQWGQTANIAYPRALLEHLDGFDEAFPAPAGEDTDLLQRALAGGARLHAAPEVLTFHAALVEPLRARARATWRWQHIACVVGRHPSLRRDFPLGLFWKARHARLALALAGAPLARRAPALSVALALPWAQAALPRYGRSRRGLVRAVSELPGRAVADGAEMTAVARGAVRYRTLVL
jgi:glycosyltransferase involved in cell wall biosynthesis